MTYNSQDGNKIFIHIPNRTEFKITKAGLLFHNMIHLLKNKNNEHIMVNDSLSPIPQFVEKKKQFTTRDVNRADSARQFHHITAQPENRILHAVYNNILNNIPILREYFGMDEDIYGPSIPHL